MINMFATIISVFGLSISSFADTPGSETISAANAYKDCIEKALALGGKRQLVLGVCRSVCQPKLNGNTAESLAHHFNVVSCEATAISWCQSQNCSEDSGCKGTDGCWSDTGGVQLCSDGRRIPKSSSCDGGSGGKPQQVKQQQKSTPQEKSTPTEPASVSPKGRYEAQQQANQDLQTCSSLQSRANQCCNNPSSCGAQMTATPTAASSQKDIQAYCQQINQVGQANMASNQNAGQVCYSSYSSCTGTCGSLIQKYDALAASCNGCDAQQVYEQTIDELESRNNLCQGLSSKLSALGSQGLNSGMSASDAELCRQTSAASPQSLASASPTSRSDSNYAGSGSNSNSMDCSTNPSSSRCQSMKNSNGQAGFDGATKDKSDSSGFNLGDSTASSNFKGAAQHSESTPVKVGTVSNNSGGALPQKNSAPVRPGNSRTSLSPGSPGYSTDILQGVSSPSGYSSSNVNGGFESDREPYLENGQKNSRTPATDDKDLLDLKRYLPGGDLNSQFNRLGGFNIPKDQIHGKHVNLWERISVRFQEKCRLGILIDCR